MNPQETSMELSPAVVPPLGDGSQFVIESEDYPHVDVENLITEDGAPVDSIYAEKQQRLLTETLYASWQPAERERRFVVLSNVGLFTSTERPPLAPDCLLSLDVEVPRNLRAKDHHSYFIWKYGKIPEVVIEIVSDRRGGEEDYKMSEYAWMRIPYYVIFDPSNWLGGETLRVMELQHRRYRKVADNWLEDVGLGLTLWQGVYEGAEEPWLRWCDREGHVLLTGRERAEQERQRADEANERIKRLEAQLRAQGIEPSA